MTHVKESRQEELLMRSRLWSYAAWQITLCGTHEFVCMRTSVCTCACVCIIICTLRRRRWLFQYVCKQYIYMYMYYVHNIKANIYNGDGNDGDGVAQIVFRGRVVFGFFTFLFDKNLTNSTISGHRTW